MFLNMLNEEEKKAFLELAHTVAYADGLDEKEEELIDMYARQMQIENSGYQKRPLESILTVFKSRESKKIVLMEIFALIYSDDYYSAEEKEIIESAKTVFGISDTELKLIKEWAKAMLALSAQGRAIIAL